MGNRSGTPVLRQEDRENFSKQSGLSKEEQSSGTPVLRQEDKENLSKQSGLSEEDFQKKYPNGMDRAKFGELARQLGVDGGGLDRHAFRMFDANNDGFIDFVEFMVIFHTMSGGAPEEQLRKMFRVFDVNGDGHISMKEMTRLIKDMQGIIKARNSKAEDKDVMAEALFKTLDKDEDGKVSCDEFVSTCLANDQIRNMLVM